MTTDAMKTLGETLPSADDVLRHIGLGRVRPATSVLTAVAIFTIGAIAGGALAMLFAPRARRAVRQALRASRERAPAPTNGDTDELAHAGDAARHWPEGMATQG
jgi:hypothetical protein